jgi:hypothetical protein
VCWFCSAVAVKKTICCGFFNGTRGNPLYQKKSSVSTFSPFVWPFSGVSAVTRLNVLVRVKLSGTCLFLADVARFHVFAHRLAAFWRFCCNTGQRTCPCQVTRRLPVFARHRPFPRFRPSLSRFQAFLL